MGLLSVFFRPGGGGSVSSPLLLTCRDYSDIHCVVIGCKRGDLILWLTSSRNALLGNLLPRRPPLLPYPRLGSPSPKRIPILPSSGDELIPLAIHRPAPKRGLLSKTEGLKVSSLLSWDRTLWSMAGEFWAKLLHRNLVGLSGYLLFPHYYFLMEQG